MRVFLAGATGVIGSPLVPQLLDAGHEVTAMTRSVLRAAQLEAAGADPVVCDVYDADGVRAAMAAASPDAVIHQLTSLPARLDWSSPSVCAEGTRVLVEAAPQPQWLPVLAQALGADPPAAAETPPPPHSLELSPRGAANGKAKRELGWQPRYPSWREGFAASLA